MKKTVAVFVAVMVCISTFSFPSYANEDAYEYEYTVYADKTYTYKPGDPLTEVAKVNEWSDEGEYGDYPTRSGAILVTEDAFAYGIVGHAALVYSADKLLHATADGVVVSKNNWRTARTRGVIGVAVKDTTYAQDVLVSQWCYEHRGTPYNYNFFNKNTRDRLYCSQMVYAGYLDNTGVDLDTAANTRMAVAPYELITSPETFLIYVYNWSK